MALIPRKIFSKLWNCSTKRSRGTRLFFWHIASWLRLTTGSTGTTSITRPVAWSWRMRQSIPLFDWGEAHLALAVHFYNGYRDYDHARDELAIAVRGMPNNARIFEWRGYIDRRQVRWHEAERDFMQAMELDPQNRDLLFGAAFTYICLREYKQAREVSDRGLALESKNNYIRLLPGWIDFHEQADTQSWHAALERILSDDPASSLDLHASAFFSVCTDAIPSPRIVPWQRWSRGACAGEA
jgi:tetratricopeptide (TPR) repeat protein